MGSGNFFKEAFSKSAGSLCEVKKRVTKHWEEVNGGTKKLRTQLRAEKVLPGLMVAQNERM